MSLSPDGDFPAFFFGLLNYSWSLSWLGILKKMSIIYLRMYFEIELHRSGWPWTCYVVEDGPWVSALVFPLTSCVLGGIAGLRHCAQFYVVPGMEPRASCTLGKHSTNRPTVPAHGCGAGEMAPQFKAPVALAEDRRSGFSSQHPHCGLQPSMTPAPGGPAPCLASDDTRHAHGTHTHMQAKYSYT